MNDYGNFTADLVHRYPALLDSADDIGRLGQLMLGTVRAGGTILSCGNGGSAADADHIAGELMKGFLLARPLTGQLRSLAESAMDQSVLPADPAVKTGASLVAGLQSPIRALSLCSNQVLLTAIMNDQGQDMVFAQQILGLCKPGDLLICLSTSGRSQNVLAAAAMAKVLGAKVAALTGPAMTSLSAYCDVAVRVPGADAGQVQDLHRPVYHALCAYLEWSLFAGE